MDGHINEQPHGMVTMPRANTHNPKNLASGVKFENKNCLLIDCLLRKYKKKKRSLTILFQIKEQENQIKTFFNVQNFVQIKEQNFNRPNQN